ncbi:MAG TPA: hypothetical protein VGQ57_08235 [Polyangiaceae bacterium]|jgi:pimeloyl-ACP methyl ester carboxylesterase|nr:hypothetical protein [Polyangiaceae bacterium]
MKMARLSRKLVARAAAGLDRAVTFAVRVALPIPDDDPHLGIGHEERVAGLRAAVERLKSLELAGFFPEPRVIEPLERSRGRHGGQERSDLSWSSLEAPFFPELEERFRATHQNGVALARCFTRGSGRPVAILVHGYLLGQLAVEQYVWPIAELDALGFDSAVLILPFHGRRADPLHTGRPDFPGRDPLFASEGFRQAVTDLRELANFLRRRGHAKVGAFGMSLGAYTAALAATVDPSFDFLIPIVPLASLADFALEHGELPEAPEPRAVEYALLEEVYRFVSPVHRPPLIAPERTLVLGARSDRITRFSHARRLASHFHAELVAFEGGHVLQWGLGSAFPKVAALLKRI